MFLIFGVYSLALWYGSKLIIDNQMTGGDVLTVFFSVLMGAFALGQSAPSLEAISKGQGAAAKIYATIDRKPLIDSSSAEGKRIKNVKGNISFENVFFTYPTRPDAPVLSDFKLEIKSGQTVALVGHSSSGKSSIVSLIQRFYDPEDGKITLDGKNLKKLNIYWLRQQIGLVSQEPVLFSGTIAENISYGKPDATMDEITAAAKAANAHDFISEFPDGYDTQVGEKGAQMSGGQKQRIAIARAIIKNPKILLLDEATSALDSQSEKEVQDALNSIMKGRTTVVVAHRLSTIRDADQIIVLSHGNVVEQGNHESLMESRGVYFELVKSQSGGFKHTDKKKANAKAKKSHHHDKEEEHKAADAKDEEVQDIPFKRLVAMNKPELPAILIGCLSAAVNGSTQPAFSIIFSEMVNLFYQPPPKIEEDNWKWALGFLGIGFVPLIFITFQSCMFAYAGGYLTLRLRDNAFKSTVKNHMGWFDKKENGTGTITARLASEATLVEGLVGTRLGLSVQNICTIICGLGIAFYYGWKLTLVVLACSPLIAFANAMHMTAMKGFTEKFRKANESANQIATEGFSNIRTVASFTREDFIIRTFVQKMEEPQKLAIKSSITRGFLTGLGQLFLFGSYTLSFWYGGKLIDDGEYTFLNVMKVFFAIVMCAMGLGQAAGMAPDAAAAKRAASVIFKLIDHKSEIDPTSPEGEKPESLKGKIEFKTLNSRTQQDLMLKS